MKNTSITIYKSIADQLAVEPKTFVDITFTEFGIPTGRATTKGMREYIIKQLGKTDGETVRNLATHLGITVPEEDPGFWIPGYFRIFISHLDKKKKFATELKEELKAYAISCFVAHADIKVGEPWQKEIETGISTCDCFVALMEKGFHASKWTDHEIGFALGRNIPVIAVDKGESPYGFIQKLQAHKFRGMPALLQTLLRILTTDKRTARKMAHALLFKFEKSRSFAEAAQNLRQLKSIRYWDDALLKRLKDAPKNNDQIRGSFDVPEGVKRLHKKVLVSLKKPA